LHGNVLNKNHVFQLFESSVIKVLVGVQDGVFEVARILLTFRLNIEKDGVTFFDAQNWVVKALRSF